MPDWIEDLRSRRSDVPLWDEMVDVIDAANEFEAWGGDGNKRNLLDALTTLRAEMLPEVQYTGTRSDEA